MWEESNELNFVVVGPAGDVQFLPTSANFIRHFPHMSAVAARQHPQPAFSGREEFESGFNAAACDGCP